ncbi:hypothetical protein niasHS_007085 [Heterodera schachtii]|uniref:Peptidase M12A domain-containing protein n=1 Tax=Heterodera schachtii TaxID=97005 RepID=A0ABD2JFW6_HETSC
MGKHMNEMEKDEKLKEMVREIEEAQAKHPGEKRKAAKSITEINEKHLDELYQGDIVLSVKQAQYLLDTVATNGHDNNSPTENRAIPEKYFNFQKKRKESIDDYQVPYDLGSVMHYGAKMFSINGKHTILPLAGASYINTIGQSYGPSLSDYNAINKHYCGLEFLQDGSTINTKACDVTMKCDNDGFQNPDSCSTCICPPGYIGAKCQDVDIGGYAPASINNTCEGKILFASSNWQNLTGQIGSRELSSKMDYAYCHWQIFPDIGQTILIEVLDVGEVCADRCLWGNTEIRTAANRGTTGVRLCCLSDLGSSGKLTITATNGYAMISLYSFYGIQRFDIRFKVLNSSPKNSCFPGYCGF